MNTHPHDHAHPHAHAHAPAHSHGHPRKRSRTRVVLAALGILALVIIAVLAWPRGAGTAPKIKFVTVGTGTLATDIRTFVPRQRFRARDKQLLGVAIFDALPTGSQVQAMWFAPDDRRPPLGMRVITAQSGSLITRFSIANSEPWGKGPYMLQIIATRQAGKKTLTASGSVHFFVDMSDKEIGAYIADYQAWQKQMAEQAAQAAAQQKAQEGNKKAKDAP